MTYHIDFEPVGRRGQCRTGATLLDCARELGVDLVNLCGGMGSCGACRIQILKGDVSEVSAREEEFFGPQELADGYRLACRVIPQSDCKVRVPPESLTTPQRTQVEGVEASVPPEPPVQVVPVTLAEPSLDDLRADTDRLHEALLTQHDIVTPVIDLGVLQTLSTQLRDQKWQASVALRGSPQDSPRGSEVVAVAPPALKPLGLAVDLGTTKIAGYLVDMETGRTLTSRGIMNPQISYGEDVISRMVFAQDSPDQAAQLQGLVVEALDKIAAEMCTEMGARATDIVEAVVVGNTAMHHLFLRLPTDQLSLAPYVPGVGTSLDVKARDVGLHIAPGGYIHLLPNIAGYVGADHVAVLLAIDMIHADGVVLALDIGTNTEVCLANHGRLTSLSCASGPAFEGAHIRHGMRAARGAIEHLRLVDDQLELKTIGDAPAVGLCGSGILDTLAQLYLGGIVDERGRMGEHPRVRDDGKHREFVIVAEDERPAGLGAEDGRESQALTFTQKDVRELQLAKGAMRTGIQVLLEANELAGDDIDKVIIAGAFGTYIDVSSAIAVGMLPRLPLDRFEQVGNAAGMGAKLALISQSMRDEARAMSDRVGYIELATAPRFMQVFSQSMYLGDDRFG